MKKLLLTITAVSAIVSATAQEAGDLDSTFGIDGAIYNDFMPNTSEFWWDMIVLDDDKIIKAGYSDDTNNKDVLVARFKADGTPDSTFANNGYLTIDIGIGMAEEARAVYELDNGQLLVTGFRVNLISQTIDAFLLRLNADGTVDTSFGATAPGRTEFNAGDNDLAFGAAILEANGELYVGASANNNGQADMYLFNFIADGTIDNSFASSGYAEIDVNGEDDLLTDLELTGNGSFVISGSAGLMGVDQAVVTVLTQFGTPTGFGTQQLDFGGAQAEIRDLYVDDNDYIYAVGSQGSAPDIDGFVARFKNDVSGDLDDTWGTAGMVQSNPGATVEMQLYNVMPVWDGGIVVTGNTQGASIENYALMLTSTGGVQSEFSGGDVYLPLGSNPSALTALCAVTQSDGGIVIGGSLQSQDFVGSAGFLTKLITIQDVSGIDELATVSIDVYPNPVAFEFNLAMEGVQTAQLLSMEGRIVASWEGTQSSYQLPAGVTAGVYILQVQGIDFKGTTRIAVQ